MHLMYYLNEKGERVYTLKKSHGEEEQPTSRRTPRASAPTTSSARSASLCKKALRSPAHAKRTRCPMNDWTARAAPVSRLPDDMRGRVVALVEDRAEEMELRSQICGRKPISRGARPSSRP